MHPKTYTCPSWQLTKLSGLNASKHFYLPEWILLKFTHPTDSFACPGLSGDGIFWALYVCIIWVQDSIELKQKPWEKKEFYHIECCGMDGWISAQLFITMIGTAANQPNGWDPIWCSVIYALIMLIYCDATENPLTASSEWLSNKSMDYHMRCNYITYHNRISQGSMS